MPSSIVQALYEGRRADAEALAADAEALDLLDAAALGDGGAVRALLAAGASPHEWSDDGFTALHYAGFFGTPDAVAALIAAGADLDVASRNEMGVRPINSAAAGPHPTESVRLLLAAGAAVDGRQASGHTALDEAEIRNDGELAALLRAHGATDARQ
jgi:ankyrin repeat protein